MHVSMQIYVPMEKRSVELSNISGVHILAFDIKYQLFYRSRQLKLILQIFEYHYLVKKNYVKTPCLTCANHTYSEEVRSAVYCFNVCVVLI